MKIWPNLFIVGAPKAGTTSLHEYLNQVPEIFMSKIKEPHYFSSSVQETEYIKPIRKKEEYLQLFEKAKFKKIIGESSVSYLSDPKAPELIHETVPHAKIIISLRDPIEIIYSDFINLQVSGIIDHTFHEEVKTRTKMDSNIPNRPKFGLYTEWIKKYLEIFGNENVKILIFEEWIKNPKKTLKEILDFFKVDYDIERLTFEAHNKLYVPKGDFEKNILQDSALKKIASMVLPTKSKKFLKKSLSKEFSKPKIDPADREILRQYYYEDVQKLKKILGRELPWKNFENNT